MPLPHKQQRHTRHRIQIPTCRIWIRRHVYQSIFKPLSNYHPNHPITKHSCSMFLNPIHTYYTHFSLAHNYIVEYHNINCPNNYPSNLQPQLFASSQNQTSASTASTTATPAPTSLSHNRRNHQPPQLISRFITNHLAHSSPNTLTSNHNQKRAHFTNDNIIGKYQTIPPPNVLRL